jgi:hypothetical protein
MGISKIQTETLTQAQKEALCVPKIRFCDIGDEDRRGQVAM